MEMLTSLVFRYIARAAGLLAVIVIASQIHIWIDSGAWRSVSTATVASALFPETMNAGAVSRAWWHSLAYKLPLAVSLTLVWLAGCIASFVSEVSAIQSDPRLLARAIAED